MDERISDGILRTMDSLVVAPQLLGSKEIWKWKDVTYGEYIYGLKNPVHFMDDPCYVMQVFWL